MRAVPYERGLHEVADGVFAFLQPPGTWGLSNSGLIVGDSASLLVDTFFDLDHTRALLDATSDVTVSAPIRTVVNTHAHSDHSWGNQLVDGAEIVGSTACAQEMGETPPELFQAALVDPAAMGQVGEFFARIFGAFNFEDIRVTPPTTTFDGELTIEAGGRTVQLIEVGPAHTRGDAIVFLPAERVLISGDILFVGGHPVTMTGSVFGWIQALDRVLALDVDVIVPGHGPVSTTDEAARLKEYFELLAAEARPRFESGMTALDAARDIPLDDYATWHAPERVAALVAALYRDMSGNSEANALEVLSLMAQLAC